jgi:hypothetical protein
MYYIPPYNAVTSRWHMKVISELSFPEQAKYRDPNIFLS